MHTPKQIPKSVSLRVVIGIVLSSILITGSVLYYVWAATAPTSTFWITNGGIYPGAPAYTVWREGTNYFAKDANGRLSYSGTNASGILQDCIDSASVGAILLASLIPVSYQLAVSEYGLTIMGQNQNTTGLVASTSFTGDAVIKVVSGHYVRISNLFIDAGMNNDDNATGAKYGIWADGFDVQVLTIDHVTVKYAAKYDVWLNGNEVTYVSDSVFVESFDSCVLLQDSTNFHFTRVEVGGSQIGNGYHFVYAREGQFTSCSSYWNGNNTYYGYNYGNGYFITYKTWGIVFTNCEAEDNWYEGFWIWGGNDNASRPGNLTFIACRGIHNGQHGGAERTHGLAIANATFILVDACTFYDDQPGSEIQDGGLVIFGNHTRYIQVSDCMTYGNFGSRVPNIGIELDPDLATTTIRITNSWNHTAWIASVP